MSASDTPLYARRDIEDLCEYYTRHLDAMTRENLHSKSDIAAELAWRDRELAAANAEIDSRDNDTACIPEDRSVTEYVTYLHGKMDATELLAEAMAGALRLAQPLAEAWVAYLTRSPEHRNGTPSEIQLSALNTISEAINTWDKIK